MLFYHASSGPVTPLCTKVTALGTFGIGLGLKAELCFSFFPKIFSPFFKVCFVALPQCCTMIDHIASYPVC